MTKTSFLQKMLLILLGIILAMVLLERAMRLGGLSLLLLKERDNKVSFDEDEIRILCVGESTTAMGGKSSYPSQLESILNQKGLSKKFKVINKGLVSTTSDEILGALEGHLDRYRPHIVVGMIGINDYLIERNVFSFKGEAFIKKFKVFKLYELIRLKLVDKSKTKEEYSKDSIVLIEKEKIAFGQQDVQNELDVSLYMFTQGERVIEEMKAAYEKVRNPFGRRSIALLIKKQNARMAWILVRIGKNLRSQGHCKDAEKFLSLAIRKDSNNVGAYVEQGRCYKESGDFEGALEYFKKASAISPDSLLVKIEMGNCYSALNKYDEAYAIAQSIFGEDIHQEAAVNSQIAGWFKGEKYYDFAENRMLKAIEKNSNNYLLYEDLADLYAGHEEKEKAKEFYRKSLLVEAENEGYPMVTVHNYNKIVDLVGRRGIRMIVMQYPQRQIEPLKKIFWTEIPILFLENKDNFEKALQYESYKDYFSDRFGGNFGHCTYKGNHLIADNLANLIIEGCLKK